MPSDTDRVTSGLVTFIRRTLGAFIVNRVDNLPLYSCKVVNQNSDGTLNLIADDTRVGTFIDVPIRYGVPGVKATVPPGARCYVTFANADLVQPIVVGWVPGTVLGIVVVDGTKGAARLDDTVDAASTMATWIANVVSYINSHGGSISAPTDFGKISSGSTKVKIG